MITSAAILGAVVTLAGGLMAWWTKKTPEAAQPLTPQNTEKQAIRTERERIDQDIEDKVNAAAKEDAKP